MSLPIPVGRASLPAYTPPKFLTDAPSRTSLPAYTPPEPLEPVITRYRRHWQLTGATYFVTWRLHPSQVELASIERDLVVSTLRHFDGER